jgi:single-strand DNA-binding protein
MRTFNKVILMGNLARDPEYKSFESGKQCVNFPVAVNRKWTGPEGQEGEETSFIACQAWGGQAKTISDYFSKGRPIFIEGHLKQDKWEKDGQKKSRIRVMVDNFQFIDSKKTETEAIPAATGGSNSDEDDYYMTDSDFDALDV